MTWPPWSQPNNACNTHGQPDCPECQPHWNPQLVAQLEAERATGTPRRIPKTLIDTPEQIAKRRQLATEIARRGRAKKVTK